METFNSSNKQDDLWKKPALESECYECNICFDSDLSEPVVTLCGHLYCWPCIYLWLHRLQISFDDRDHDHDRHDDHKPKPNCPVCKAEISDSLLVPLYGRGGRQPHTGHAVVPRRPAPPKLDIRGGDNCSNLFEERNLRQPLRHLGFGGDSGSETPSYSYVRTSIFGISRSPNSSYPAAGHFSERIRRREMRMERSLHRVSLFIFCCLVMCLLFF